MKAGRQTTLRDDAAVTGIGVHSGLPVTLTLHPADADTGIGKWSDADIKKALQKGERPTKAFLDRWAGKVALD